jgi:shikimate dehydrogenase
MELDGCRLKGSSVAILGAGGAGRAVAMGCAFAGAARVFLLNRTLERAQEVARELAGHGDGLGATEWVPGSLDDARSAAGLPWSEIDAVLQMTSLGMKPEDPMPAHVEFLRGDCHVLEAVYSPLETKFLAAARSKGLPTTDGLAMLLEQGAISYEFWFGQAPDRPVMRQALELARQGRP